MRIARWIIFVALLLTLVLNYGGENFQLGGLWVPFVWILIGCASLLTGTTGFRILLREYPHLCGIWSAVCVGGAVRLYVDYPDHGLWALRNSLFFTSSVGLLIGLAAGWHLRRHAWPRLVTIPVVLAVLYASLLPWSEQIRLVAPSSTVFQKVPLFGYHSNAYVPLASLWGGLFGGLASGLLAMALVAIGLTVTALGQQRLAYMALPIAGLTSLAILSRARAFLVPAKTSLLVAAGFVSLLAVSSLAPIPGKVGEFEPGFLVEHLGTILGREGPAAGSVYHRYGDYPSALRNLLSEPLATWLVGRGLGAEIGLGVTGILVKSLHLDFVETIYRMGAVGILWVILVLAITGTTLRRSMRWIAAGAFSGQERGVMLMICSLLLFTVVTSLFQPIFYWTYGAFPFYFYGGLALGVMCRLRTERSAHHCPR